MRLVYLGSPEPAIAPLAALVEHGPAAGHDVALVVSQPARPVGRSQTPVDPPVAAWAKAHGLPTLQPERASDPEFLSELRRLAPDVMITAAYGQILTDEFLAIPRRATINIHPSLLPRHRGATPVPAALLAGEAVSGVTVLFTVAKLDAGNIIVQESSPIGPDETAGALTRRYFALGAKLVLQALDRLADPEFRGAPQDPAAVTHCRKIHKTDGCIDWTRPASEIYDRFRAYDPWPGSYTHCRGRRYAVVAMATCETDGSGSPGEVGFDKTSRALKVRTGDGCLRLLRLKPAGGKEIDAAAFWNGIKDRTHVVFTHDQS